MLLSKLFKVLLLATQASVSAADNRKEDTITTQNRLGAWSGDWFDDGGIARTNHQRIAAVHMTSCESEFHITKLDIGYRDNHDPNGKITWTRHGGLKSSLQTVVLDLAKDEYITRVLMTEYMAKTGKTWPHKYKNRIGSVRLWTSKNQFVACGAWNYNNPSQDDEGDKHALLYFQGSSGDAIDSLATNWIPEADF